MNRNSVTLLELLIVIVIIGILAAIAIPRFANIPEREKGIACKNTTTAILSAWRIHNITSGNIYVEGTDAGFYTIEQINITLHTEITMYDFGIGATPGFYMSLDSANNRLRIYADRLNTPPATQRIACYYYYPPANVRYDWDPNTSPWDTTWPYSL